MRLVDTSAWIEWLAASSTGKRVGDHIPPRHEWLVPTIVQLELAKWLWRETGEDKADQVLAFIQLCVLAPLDTPIALSAADICAKHRLATADAIIYATAQAYGAELLTCDAHFEALPKVTYIQRIIA